MPSPYLCERFHPTRGCVSPNFRPETTFSKVAGRVRTADLQARRLPLNPLLHWGLTTKNFDLPEKLELSEGMKVARKIEFEAVLISNKSKSFPVPLLTVWV